MTVLIAENDVLHRAFARRVVTGLWEHPIEVIEVADGADAIRLVRRGDILQAVLDLSLPSASGVEIARALWAERAEAQVVFWTNFADEAYVRGVARVVPPGASYGYLLKSAPEGEMRSALRSVFILDRPAIQTDIRAMQRRLADRLAGLTDAEYEALTDIALGLTDRVIANRRALSVRGVQSRLTHLYEKLDIVHDDRSDEAQLFNPRARAITLALQRGLLNYDILAVEQIEFERWLMSQRSCQTDRGHERHDGSPDLTK